MRTAMGGDNPTNVQRQADAEARVLEAVARLTARGEPVGLRAIAREAQASLATVRKLRPQWEAMAAAALVPESINNPEVWRARLAAFHPHPMEGYLESIWPEPVTPHTIARWYHQMALLRRLYGSRSIRLASRTYRMYADWMNAILAYAEHRYHPRVLRHCVNQWDGDPTATLLADGALAGIRLPDGIKERLASIGQPSPTSHE